MSLCKNVGVCDSFVALHKPPLLFAGFCPDGRYSFKVWRVGHVKVWSCPQLADHLRDTFFRKYIRGSKDGKAEDACRVHDFAEGYAFPASKNGFLFTFDG